MRAILLLASLAAVAVAGEVKLPAEVRVKPGRLAKIVAECADKAPVRWVNVHADLDLIESETGRWAMLSSPRPGLYKVAAYSDMGGPPAYVVVVVEGDVVPPPVPPPPVPPPPVPPPPVPPKPTDAPAWVVVIEETAEAGKGRRDYWSDPALAAKLKGLGARLRLADKDVRDKDGQPPADLKPYLDRSRGKALPQCYVISATGGVLFEGPLPSTAARLSILLDSLGGGK
jgi:hypothetical protein